MLKLNQTKQNCLLMTNLFNLYLRPKTTNSQVKKWKSITEFKCRKIFMHVWKVFYRLWETMKKKKILSRLHYLLRYSIVNLIWYWRFSNWTTNFSTILDFKVSYAKFYFIFLQFKGWLSPRSMHGTSEKPGRGKFFIKNILI